VEWNLLEYKYSGDTKPGNGILTVLQGASHNRADGISRNDNLFDVLGEFFFYLFLKVNGFAISYVFH